MATNILAALFGSKRERDIKRLLPVLHAINEQEQLFLNLRDDEFPARTQGFRDRLAAGATIDEILPEAFSLAREAARRVLGERPFDVQIIGGLVLNEGKIVEMKTGEGKTLSSVAATYLNAIPGDGVHVVTVNDYLALRDSEWMGRVFRFLGLTVGCILSNMDNELRRKAYACDITYGTNNEFGFDYLRDNMTWSPEGRVQRGHNYCVVDEIDSILIDEARTPLIISGPAEDDTFKVNEVNRLASQLVEVKKNPATGEYPKEEEGEELVGDYKVEEKSKRISFSPMGMTRIEELLLKRGLIKGSLFDESNFEFVHYFTQSVKAMVLFAKDVDYVVQDGLVQIVDEFTGRILTGRRYSDGLHEAIEAKERIKIARRNRTLATITFQNYFRLYKKISGMTGTADTEASEFAKIYNLDVVVIPTNRPLARKDEDDLVFLNEGEKFDAIADEITEAHKKGQPVLVGTVSIEKSEKLSALLTRRGLRHEILNAKNHAREALIIAEAGARGSVTIATNMAGRGTDIKLGGNPEYRARRAAGTQATEEQYQAALKIEYDKWRKDYEEVRGIGGLYVVGTERHESRRIDNQLRGRSGRQGDPGRSMFFLSLDDDLMRLFGGDNYKGLMSRLGMKEGEAIYHPLLNRTIANAQKKVEERNFEIRKHLLEYDDVLNQQRKFIYDQRNEILKDGDLKARAQDTAKEMVSSFLEAYEEDQKKDASSSWAIFQENLRENFNIQVPWKSDMVRTKTNPEIAAEAEQLLDADIANKVSFAGEDNLNGFIRFQYLQSIDNRWLDHLESMEALREAVYLRSYGQKNPLLEYKLEGFDIFERMIEEIRRSIAMKLYLVHVQTPEARQASSVSVQSVSASHADAAQFGGGGTSTGNAGGGAQRSAVAEAARPAGATVVRSAEKVGRNDPCPCGSGKKYKHCHGQ
ncbi:MAG: preprotein translocase subunit SecA [Spirochaetota bacterium]